MQTWNITRMASDCCFEVAKPQHWFNEIKHPAFQIASIAFPAYLLPFLVCTLLLAFKAHQRRSVPRDVSPHATRDAWRSQQKEKERLPDNENQIMKRDEQRHPRFHKALTHAVRLHNQMWSYDAVLGRGQRFPLGFVCSLHVATLVLAGTVLDHNNPQPRLFAAIGWVALFLNESSGQVNSIISVGTVFSALPCVWMFGDSHYSSISGLLLLAMASDPLIPADSPVRGPKFQGNELWPLAILAALALLKSAIALSQHVTATSNDSPSSERLRSFAQEVMTKYIPEIANDLARACAFMVPLAVFFLFTSLCCSCLGWRPLLYGLPAQAPALVGGGTLGGMLFALAWLIQMVLEMDRRQAFNSPASAILFAEMATCAVAAGWTVMALTILWAFLMVVSS